MSSRKNNFEKVIANRPKCLFTGLAMDEKRTGIGLPCKREVCITDLHEIQKRHTFNNFCKKMLRHEVGNGYGEINRRARGRFVS